MSEKKKLERLKTPVGECRWAHVHKPKPGYKDERTGTEGPPKFQIDVYFDPAKDPAWKAWLDEITKQWFAIPKQLDKDGDEIKKQKPFRRELDENDKPTGRLFVTFKTGAEYQPGVFDNKLPTPNPIPPTVLIGNGSLVRVNYSPNTYEAFGGGINFYLNAVQVVKLVEYKAKSAKAYAFEGEEPPTEGDDMPPEDSEDCPF